MKTSKQPQKRAAALDELKLYNIMLDCVSSMEKSEYTGSYIESVLKCVKSWLAHNGKEVKRKIRIKGARDAPTLQEERVPNKEELRRTYLSCDKKTRAACVLVSQCGLRIQTLGNYVGKDGLRIGDFPEMKIENDSITFEHTPTIVVVRKELSKARHQYLSFLGEEGCEYLKDYLIQRMLEGEKLTAKSPIITPKLKMKSFMRTINVGDNMRMALRAAGINSRPYVLRCYFDTHADVG